MPSPSQRKGYRVEQQAKRFLKRRGLSYLSQHFHCRYGEIDLIMKESDMIVFVEVRSRAHNQFANAIESINVQKQQKIIKTMQIYLLTHQLPHLTDHRLDVVGKDGNDNFYWIRNALEVQ